MSLEQRIEILENKASAHQVVVETLLVSIKAMNELNTKLRYEMETLKEKLEENVNVNMDTLQLLTEVKTLFDELEEAQ